MFYEKKGERFCRPDDGALKNAKEELFELCQKIQEIKWELQKAVHKCRQEEPETFVEEAPNCSKGRYALREAIDSLSFAITCFIFSIEDDRPEQKKKEK
jgi:uncharacterized protein (DUF342 family)